MKKLLLFSILLFSGMSAALAQEKPEDILKKYNIEVSDNYTDQYLDTLVIDKKGKINDYDMIGIQYGVGLSQVMWNPTQKQEMVLVPLNIGVVYTKYGKMFGYMPYFGFQVGAFFLREGYKFKYNKDTDYTYKVEGAESAMLSLVEVPLLAHMHIDFWKMKVLVNLGCYGGYRLSIHRFAGNTGYVKPEVENSFLPTDRRWDYGLKGGVGFAFVFDPIEIHIQGMYKHSLSSLYQPDYYSKDYYRFAYPSNIVISVGLHVQITKRTGMTKSQIKKLAKESVYGTENQ